MLEKNTELDWKRKGASGRAGGVRSGKYQHWDKKGVAREDGNLGQSFLNLGRLFNLLLLVGLAEKCSGTFPRRSIFITE